MGIVSKIIGRCVYVLLWSKNYKRLPASTNAWMPLVRFQMCI